MLTFISSKTFYSYMAWFVPLGGEYDSIMEHFKEETGFIVNPYSTADINWGQKQPKEFSVTDDEKEYSETTDAGGQEIFHKIYYIANYGSAKVTMKIWLEDGFLHNLVLPICISMGFDMIFSNETY